MATNSLLTVFDKIQRDAAAGRIDLASKSRSAMSWLAHEAQKYPRLVDQDIHGEQRLYPRPEYGNLYAFHYYPKHANTLPYFDIFPLVFRIGDRTSGFLGMNLHYLSPARRFKLMRGLIQTMGMTDRQKRLMIDYSFLKNVSGTTFYKPCVKHYLRNQYRSQFMKIKREDWEIALYLPTATFQKMEKSTVWRKSNEQIRGYLGV